MEEKTSAYIWPEDLTLQMLELRLSNDKLFKLKRQPWREFYKILLKNGFPKYVSQKQVAKKFGYLFSMYRIAKKENDKSWKYYDMFNKIFKKSKELGKYESWSNEWRSKLIVCITTAKEQNLDHKTLWRTVERAMRSQNLPEDCCVYDMQGLWHYLKMVFVRTYRLMLKKGTEDTKWPLYDAMLSYYKTYENLEALENEPYISIRKRIKTEAKTEKKETDYVDKNDNKQDFVWSKDLTESLIHIRLRNDSLFNERPQAWKDFTALLKNEYGFPDKLKFSEVSKKWQTLYAEYQKAKSAKNTAWCYYTLFEAYLDEGTPSINPLFYWQEKWAIKLIEARTDLEDLFVESQRNNPSSCWREVDKKLRRDGIPLDHSLLDLDYIWNYLMRTYKTKKRHAAKGVLKEQWPYFTSMAKYMEIHESKKNQSNDFADDDAMINDYAMDDDDDDDIKLFDLKQRLELKESKDKRLKLEGKQCRACANVAECVDIFEVNDETDVDDIATKLSLIAGVQVEKSDRLPPQICYDCLQELENAYKFRRKCQDVDEQFRESCKNIKIEILEKIDDNLDLHDDLHDNEDFQEDNDFPKQNEYVEVPVQKTVKERKKYKRYCYMKVCEICGIHTENLKSHIDKHNAEKPYSCEICGRKFKFKNALNVHKGTVHATTPKKTCEVCGKTFNNMAYYKKHYAYHANERKFSCETCGKRFNSADCLKVHNFIHTGERPYVCSECGKTFRTAGCVGRHKRIVHKIMRKVE